MLKIYDYLDELLEDDYRRSMNPIPLRHLASDVMDQLGYCNEGDLHNALMRAFEVCCSLHIPISENFKKVYRYKDNLVEIDWQISDLGCYLLLINGNSCNPNVAKAQLRAIISKSAKM